MKKFLLSVICLYAVAANAQQTGDFRTKQSGNWSSITTWQRYNSQTGWTDATYAPSSSDGVISILNTHTVTVNSAITVDQVLVSGTLNISASITLNDGTGDELVINGAATFNSGASLKGLGSIIHTGTTTLNTSITVPSTISQQQEDLIQGTGTFTINGVYNWAAGQLAAPTVLTSTAVLSFTTANAKFIYNTLTNDGTINWQGGNLRFGNGSLTNNKTFNITTTAYMDVYTGTGQFTNAAAGIVILNGTTITFYSPLNNNGTIKGTGTFAFNGTLTNNGTIAPGLSPGTLNVTTTQTLLTVNSTLAVETQDTVAGGSDKLVKTNLSLALNGKLTVTEIGTPPVGNYVIVTTPAGNITGNFTSLSIPKYYLVHVNAKDVTLEKLPSISVNNKFVTEGNSGTQDMKFTVSLNLPSNKTVTVNYATSSGTATSGSDYSSKSGSLTFDPGVTNRSVTITTKGDAAIEADETFKLLLKTPVNAVFADSLGIGTIVNDDFPFAAVNDTSVNEGNSGSTPQLKFTVSLSAASLQPISINYQTLDSTAIAGTDYTAASGTINFAAGETTKNIIVNITGDNTVESNEKLKLKLTTPVKVNLSDSIGVGTIINDDIPLISINNKNTTEGNSGTTKSYLNISLDNPSYQTVTVNYKTSSSTASSSSDYISKSGSISFAPGETLEKIYVEINGDVTIEPDEKFKVLLSNPVNAKFGDSVSYVTIVNDDGSSGRYSACDTNPVIDFSVNSEQINTAKSDKLIAWPNPAVNMIHVNIMDAKILHVTDMNGKILKQVQQLNIQKTAQQIDVSNLANGMYMLVVTDKNNKQHAIKIVVQH